MNILVQNRKASFAYILLDKYISGIQLLGSEVKSIKDGNASISEAYCAFINNELYILNMHISEYKQYKGTNHEPIRNRKLLLNKNELKKIKKAIQDNGLTIIPLNIMVSNNGYIKLEISVAKGKKIYDKREDIKKKDIQKELSRNN